ncbi:MAG: type IV secretion system protein VirB10 [Porticoccaceae bacterium]|nr:type IV secretion system protein VirB10 [Porticoccaceae bacterium]BBE29030.1 type IV secretion system protein VirB10 [uncultured bacterium]
MSDNQQQTLESFDGERGMPSVNEGGPSTAKRGLVVVAALVIIILAVGAIFWKMQQKEETAAAQQKGITVASSVPTRTFVVPPPLPRPETTPAPAPEVEVPPLPGNAAPALPGPASHAAPSLPDRGLLLDKSGSSLMVSTGSRQGSAPEGAGGSGSDGGASSSLGAMLNGGDGGALASMLNSTATATRQAGHLSDRNFLLAKGSFIDCVLQTRLDSTVPGMTACVVTRNIYSDNGKVLLIERGSTVSGEYQANMRQGQERIFVLWSRIKTPHGVVINLDSPGTDPLGGAGLPGYVETHFWKRFGGAIMLSMVGDIGDWISNKASNGNPNRIQFDNTSDGAQDMATEALRNTINIPPTLYKNQGEQVGIYVARDLDFSSVYDVTSN